MSGSALFCPLDRGVAEPWRNCLGLVEGLLVLQAMVELAEEFVEQVAVRGGVAIIVIPPLLVVPAGRFMGLLQRGNRGAELRTGGGERGTTRWRAAGRSLLTRCAGPPLADPASFGDRLISTAGVSAVDHDVGTGHVARSLARQV